MSARRQVGAYEWRNELDKLSHIGEQIGERLVELSRHTANTDATRTVVQLLSLSNQVSIKSLRLRDYQVKNEQSTDTAS